MIQNITFDSQIAELMINNKQILYMLERFDIPLGFKDSNIEEIAVLNKINKHSLLAITQLIINNEANISNCEKDSIKDIIIFLKNSHKSFKSKILAIRENIDKFSNDIEGKYELLLNKFFEEYIQDIDEHFKYEEEHVFPYIENLIDYYTTNITSIKSIEQFEHTHSDTELKLRDLKNILIKYIPSNLSSTYRNKILYRLYDLEPDLYLHSIIENYILIPIVKKFEKS